MSVLNIVFVALSGALFFAFLAGTLWRLFLQKEFEKTKKIVTDEKNYICYTQGVVGAGKSTMDCGICNVICDFLRKKAEAVCVRFLGLVKGIKHRDFLEFCDRKIDDYEKAKKEGDIVPSFKICDAVDERFDKWFSNHYYWDYTKGQRSSIYIMLQSFVDARIAMKENWFCYSSSGDFVERITGVKSKPISRNDLNVKDTKKNPFRRYSVVFIDDKNSSDPNNSYSQKVSKKDGGYSLSLMLIRHFGEGSVYYLANSQNFSKDVKGERSLSTGIYNVEKNEVKKYFPFLSYVSFLATHFAWSFFRIQTRAFRASENGCMDNVSCSAKKCSLGRFLLRRAHQLADWLASKDYVEYYVTKYFSPEDVGKTNPSFGKETLRLYFPCKICFGSMPRYEYGRIYDYLNGQKMDPEEAKKYKNILTPNEKKS